MSHDDPGVVARVRRPRSGRPKNEALVNTQGQTLGEVLRLARRSSPNPISQEEAAEAVNVSRVAISDYERNIYIPSGKTFRQLLELYQFPENQTGFNVIDFKPLSNLVNGEDPFDEANYTPLPPDDWYIVASSSFERKGEPRPREAAEDVLAEILRQLAENHPLWPMEMWEMDAVGTFSVPNADGADVRHRRFFKTTFNAPQAFSDLGRCVALQVSIGDWPFFPLAHDGDLIVCNFETPDPARETIGGKQVLLLRSENAVTLGVRSKSRENSFRTLNPFRSEELQGEWTPVGKPIAVMGFPRMIGGDWRNLKFLINLDGITTQDFIPDTEYWPREIYDLQD